MPATTWQQRERIDYLVAVRPSMRGRLHAWAFWAVLPAGTLLVLAARGAAERVSAAVYACTLLAVFGTSAAYHRLAHTYRARVVMQRVDHSTIYLLIAGTYVPFCLVALPRSWGIPLMVAVGGLGVVGMVIKLSGIRRLQTLGYALYPVMGWAAIVTAPELRAALTPLQLGLVVAGGLTYTAGFPILLVRRPDPRPLVFGYHEVWHGLTVVAAALHFSAVALLLR